MTTKKLTKKQRGFIKDYLATGNGTQAALANYDTTNELTAAVIASENLTKPYIADAIRDALSDDLLAEKHLALLNKLDPISGDIDTQAVKAALDMAYRIKGTYAPEKSIVANVNVSDEHKERALRALRAHRSGKDTA